MKKLHRKDTIHPTPPLVTNHLSFLPATILTLTVALSQEDKEILAYLISCSSQKSITKVGTDHSPSFNCYCFNCYIFYWIRWDNSPNRQLIHEIIDAFEDDIQSKNEKNRKQRNKSNVLGGLKEYSLEDSDELDTVEETSRSHGYGGEDGGGVEEGVEEGSLRKFVSFLGKRIWNAWALKAENSF